MTRRSRIVTLQAGVVGVLLVVVYLTILRPNDDSSVTGVNAPGAPEQIVNAPPNQPRGQQRPQRRRPQRPTGRLGAQGGPAPGGVAATGAGGRNASAAPAQGLTPTTPVSAPGGGGGHGGGGTGGGPPTGPPGGPPDDEPTDDQYGDTLSRLTAALR